MYLEREEKPRGLDFIIATIFIEWIGELTLLSLLLLTITLGSVAVGLSETISGIEPGLMLQVAMLGMLVGWLLAKSPLPAWLAGAVAGILGIELLLIHAGHLTAIFTKLAGALFGLVVDILFWSQTGAPDMTPIPPLVAELGDSIRALLTRLVEWILALLSGVPFYDPIATSILWSAIMWGISIWAAWAVRRYRRPLQGIIPAIAVLGGGLVYNWSGRIHFLLYPLGSVLLLSAFTNYQKREDSWNEQGIDYAGDIRGDMAMATTFATIIIMGLAMLLPTLSVRPLVDFVQRITRGPRQEARQLGDSLGLNQPEPLYAKAEGRFGEKRAVGLPRSHLLRAGQELSQQIVMFVSTNDTPPHLREATGQPAPRYYWRAFTYDLYTGRGWATSDTETVGYAAGEPLITATLPAHSRIRQKVQFTGEPDGLLYAAGILVTADQDYQVAWRSATDPFGATIQAPEYQADSWMSLVGEARLRAAGKTYPDWVQIHYLRLPDSVPARVRALALELTAPEPTAYDQARAIEAYLRTYTYTLDLDEVPLGRDVADYFLFDLQRGYCDYYATAMVVLARTAGLPARVVIGYATGAYDRNNARYVVTEADAHAWVEVYFPEYGWIEFEPTASRPALDRPDEVIPPETPPTPPDLRLLKRLKQLRAALLSLIAVVAGLMLAALMWIVIDTWRLTKMPAQTAASIIYIRLRHHGHRLNAPMYAGDTPYQFAASLADRVQILARERRGESFWTRAVGEIRSLADLYVQSCYSPRAPSAAAQRQAVQMWQKLDARLWLAWLRTIRFRRIERGFS